MDEPLIILYGELTGSKSKKYQGLIEGTATCGYREYARCFGHIIYLSSQEVYLPWEHCITSSKKVIDFINSYPTAVVWAVKHAPRRDSKILTRINNKKLYYACRALKMYNNRCHVSLVDTEERIRKNARLWFKGKDPDYWKPLGKEKVFDYLLIGRRADKNELYFLDKLNKVKDKRRILWIGGKNHRKKIQSNHEVVCTSFCGPDDVRNNIAKAKVGVLFTEIKTEGFPQTFLEMTMCGVPVVYNKAAPKNRFYFHEHNSHVCSKKNIVSASESLLKKYNPEKCREEAIKNYSIEASYKRILSCIK